MKVPPELFPRLCLSQGLPRPVPEFRFAKPRRWRFDWAFPEARVAVEVEGGVYTRGRHVRPSGYLNDLEKYSEAAVRDWAVIRVTPDTLCTARTFDWITRALTRTEDR